MAEGAREEGLRLRLIGGVAIALRCPSAAGPPLRRSYDDIDVVCRGVDRPKVARFLVRHGYRPLEELNAVHGKGRLFFRDDLHKRRLDVFVDRFEMCHALDFRRRLDIEGATLPLADLLLTKLQVFETTEKDLIDIVSLLADHDFSDDDEAINLPYLRELTASNWGLWHTVALVAGRAQGFAAQLDRFPRAAARAERLIRELDLTPKSRAWSLRARIGERVRWYRLPEEPDFGQQSPYPQRGEAEE